MAKPTAGLDGFAMFPEGDIFAPMPVAHHHSDAFDEKSFAQALTILGRVSNMRPRIEASR